MNTGQTVYEQLQEIADAFAEYKGYAWINIEEDRVELKPTGGYEMITMSYHDLFSKDSGLMERVEWKNKNDGKVIEVIDKKHNLRYVFDDKYMYKHMSYLTAEDKIQYFLDNARVPTK